MACTMLEALHPADAKEAAAAARAIAAHFAAMDGFARAARPGIADDTAVRLRNNALAAARLADAVTRKAPGPTAGSREAITVVRAGRKRRDASVAGAASRRVAGDNSRSARRGDDAANAAGRSTQRDRSLAGATNCSVPG